MTKLSIGLLWMVSIAWSLSFGAPQESRVTVDGMSPGRTFEGIGALSAGASSRLLKDYPDSLRNDILDILFKPKFAATFQHLKVEIGGDINSTDGTEPSYARSREEFNHPRPEYFHRGYEWMLMNEARKRNPNIILDVLQWGAPTWIGDHQPGLGKPERDRFFSNDNANFVVSFILGAREYHGLIIDYCGIWNETPYDAAWIKKLRLTLNAANLNLVRIVAADQTPDVAPEWKIAEDISADPALAYSVHTIGAHYASSTAWKFALKEAYASTDEARKTGKPLWASEDGPWRGDWEGARALAKMFNRNYVVGKMTKTIIWSLVTSYYDNLPIPDSGPMKANSPWSGHYEIQPAIWAIAHTTQFAQPGWRYLDKSCGLLKDGGSYVTLRDSAGTDWSMIIETMDAQQPQMLSVRVSGGLSTSPLNVRRTTENQEFKSLHEISPSDRSFTIVLEPNALYSLSTTRGQHKGIPARAVPRAGDFPIPYSDDFEGYAAGETPRFFSDLYGAFEVTVDSSTKTKVLQQVITAPGIEWPLVAHRSPRTIIGSPHWTNYTVTCDVSPGPNGWAELGVRFDKPWDSGYWLRVTSDGSWQVLAADSVRSKGNFVPSASEKNALHVTCDRDLISFFVNGVNVTSLRDTTFKSGLAGIGSGWNKASFDNFGVQLLSH